MSLSERLRSRLKGKAVAGEEDSRPGFRKQVEKERSGLFQFTEGAPNEDYTVE